MSSTRLPGKVGLPVLGRPMIEHQLRRILHCKLVDKFVLATTTGGEDDVLEEVCGEMGVECFRGSRDNVLERFYLAAVRHNPKHVVRLTGDCPMSDPRLIDKLVSYYLCSGFDYVSNNIIASFPDGFDVEVFSFSALADAYLNAVLPSHLEHVTQYILKNNKFKVSQYPSELYSPNLRVTVDEADDYEVVKNVFESLYPEDNLFGWEAVIRHLEGNPRVAATNMRITRNEGLEKSLKSDEQFQSSRCSANGISLGGENGQ